MGKIAVIGGGKIFNDKYLYLLKWLRFTRKISSFEVFDLKETCNMFYATNSIDTLNYNNFDSFILLTPNNSHNHFVSSICDKSDLVNLKSVIVEKPIFTNIDMFDKCKNLINKIHSVNHKRALNSVISARNFFMTNKKCLGNNISIVLIDGIPLKWNASYLSSKNMLDSCLWDIGAHDFDVCAYSLGINEKDFKIVSQSVLEFSFQNYYCDFVIYSEELKLTINFSVRLSRVHSFLPRFEVKLHDFNEMYQVPLLKAAEFLVFNDKEVKWKLLGNNHKYSYSETEISSFLNAIYNRPSIIYPKSTDVRFSINLLENLTNIYEN